jgi:hypothetical protein
MRQLIESLRERNVRRAAVLRSALAGAAFAGALTLGTAPARAAVITVYGGPTYDQTTQTGYRDARLPFIPGATRFTPGSTAGNGVAVGFATKYTGGTNLGLRAVRWTASGAAALGNLGTAGNGTTDCRPYAVNTAGAAVGYAEKYTGGTDLGPHAVRWDASGTVATELGNLGTNGAGLTSSYAFAINDAGIAVGRADKWIAGGDRGPRAVRWNASGTAATELGNLGTDSNGITGSEAYAVNAAGTAVGYANKLTGGAYDGARGIRWVASGTAATELGNPDGTSTEATAINTAGSAVGVVQFYNGIYVAVRWDASGTAVTGLGNLGAKSFACDINAAGIAVGIADKYTGGTPRGSRAVRWDASGTAATELGNLGTDSSGGTNSYAYAINDAGIAVGMADKYTDGTNLGHRAVLWNFDAIAIDLNTLIDPNSGWTLTNAVAISDTNWVTGSGSFDPDGPGPLDPYPRAFLLDVSSAVPEPASLSILALTVPALLRRRRGGANRFVAPFRSARRVEHARDWAFQFNPR